MSTLEFLIIVSLIIWLITFAMSIENEVSAIKYEQHEIYLLLEHYLLKREVEREKQKND